jgi:cardiolipin synthase
MAAIKHLPNILSSFRILLIPVFIWLMLEDHTALAAIVLAVSGITDFLDGFLARHFGWVSAVGKVLDPVADKCTQVAACVMLIVKMPQFWYFFAILLFKELVMLVLGGWLLRQKVQLKGARWFGKVVTFLFYVIAAVIIFFPRIPGWVILILLSLITICALVAGILYIPQFISYKRQATGADPGR